jgi:hypothetical protein
MQFICAVRLCCFLSCLLILALTYLPALRNLQVRGIHGKPINLKAGSTVTVVEVSGNRVRHALGWSSAIGHRSGDTIMEPLAATGRLKGTIADVTRTHFVVQWDEPTRELVALQPQLLPEHAGSEGEQTESIGLVELPDLWIVIKGGYKHECPAELNRTRVPKPFHCRPRVFF